MVIIFATTNVQSFPLNLLCFSRSSDWGAFNNYVEKERERVSRKSTLGQVTKGRFMLNVHARGEGVKIG